MNILQINPLTNVGAIKNNKFQSRIILPAQKPDTFERSIQFNITSAMTEISNLKISDNKTLFNKEDLKVIKKEFTKTPEKYEPFKIISNTPNITNIIALNLLSKDKEDLKELAEISKINNNRTNKPKFDAEKLNEISNELSGKELNRFKYLANELNSSTFSLMDIAKNKNLKAPQKIKDKLNEIKNEHKNDYSFYIEGFYTDNTDDKSFICCAKDNQKEYNYLFDGNMNKIALEETTIINKDFQKYEIKKSVDYRNNTTSETTLKQSKNTCQPKFVNEIRTIKDKNGNEVRKEYLEPSCVNGVLNIKYIMPNGSEKIISKADFDEKTGITTIKKNLTSLDGTKTEYISKEDKNGNKKSKYKITDKNGNVLLDKTSSLKKLDENKFISTENDKKYEITIDEKNLNIKDLNSNENTNINLEKFIDNNKEVVVNLLKKAPATELIALSKTTKTIQNVDDVKSSFNRSEKTLKTGENLSSLLHELGHAKDFINISESNSDNWYKKGAISNNKNVVKTFEEEKELFNKSFPTTQREHINYFIEDEFGLSEAVAESNMLLNYHCTDDLTVIRAHYLQQYFPKTIASINNTMTESTVVHTS